MYEGSITYNSTVMAKIKGFLDKETDRRGKNYNYAPGLLIWGHKILYIHGQHIYLHTSEIIVEKGENDDHQHFVLLPQSFLSFHKPKSSFGLQ